MTISEQIQERFEVLQANDPQMVVNLTALEAACSAMYKIEGDAVQKWVALQQAKGQLSTQVVGAYCYIFNT